MAVDSARMDLAIRTGKAAARLEQEAAKAAVAVTKKAPVNAEEPSEEIPLVTAQIPTVSESMISDINSIMNDDNNKEEGDEAVAQQEAAAGVEPEETVPFTRQNRQPESMEEYNTDNDEVEEEKIRSLQESLPRYSESTGICQDLRSSLLIYSIQSMMRCRLIHLKWAIFSFLVIQVQIRQIWQEQL